MAFVDWQRPENINISQILRINHYVADDAGHVFYEIQITLTPFYWTCKRRYSEFSTLHSQLVIQFKIDQGLLPAKNIFGVKNEAFLKKRQVDLEVYLLRLWHHLRSFPRALAEFLDMHLYEIHFITEELSRKICSVVDSNSTRDELVFTPIQIHAINKRLQLPEPVCESKDRTRDFGHLLDYIYRMKTVRILGNDGLLAASNIVENQLPIELMIFKSAEDLMLDQLRPSQITGLENLRNTVKKLRIHRTLQSLSLFFLRDADGWHTEEELPSCLCWNKLVSADLSQNRIEKLDKSIKLLVNVESLDLSNNQLRTLDHLHHLHNLRKLGLARNYLSILDNMHAKLGNIQKITLSGNQLQTLKGLAKLYSLEDLDLSDNEVSSLDEIEHLRNLPCLIRLILASNPITLVVDYRVRILACFGSRASEMVLDGTPAGMQEVSRVNIRLALKKTQTAAAQIRKRNTESQSSYNGSPGQGAATSAPT
ncbi:nischarin-like [Paramacrobiotus metropolitanus]|uniref:nischarin-like n=1 Tax=Paramacrobiotus metropolitanus TaxID=2943436 RepID=UPI0024456573|nr:nischarin-like [Paramacrobiotus metropolitanus]XP_055342755.1 nischarin-like [Paramacrobiotus metropolitanus]